MTDRIVRIGGAAAHWMDSLTAMPQLIEAAPDYIMLDYLSEGAMSVLARMQQQYPGAGFPPDVVGVHIGPHLRALKDNSIKVVANGGGLDPRAACEALRQLAQAEGIALKIAYVEGDDLRERVDEFRSAGLTDMFEGSAFPADNVLSANAYLGAFPIAAALAAGADIVLTGRVSDSALALAPLIHEFGWTPDDYDALACGTLAGHLLECGCHSTGGTFTDWLEVADGWENMGFPIAECRSDGSFVLTKPDGTGGLVSRGTVGEQMLYEVSDPQQYMVADVVCDFSNVELEEIGPDRVRVTGARGYPPTGSLKVTVTYDKGWRGTLASPIVGFDAAAKARRQGQALVNRVEALLRGRNLPPFERTRIEAIGAGDTLGQNAPAVESREVILRIVCDHAEKEGAELFQREQHAAMTAMSVGTSVALGGAVQPLTAVASFLLAADDVPVRVFLNGEAIALNPAKASRHFEPAQIARPAEPEATCGSDTAEVQLIDLAWGRSGDKGGLFNVAIIARKPEHFPLLCEALTTDVVEAWFAHCFEGSHRPVERYLVPGIAALNFVVPESLGGGIMASDRLDPVAKTMAQQLLAMPVRVPAGAIQSGTSN